MPGPELYLIDVNVLDVTAPVAIGISLASIVAGGGFIYDLLCKSPDRGKRTSGLMLVLFGVAGGDGLGLHARCFPAGAGASASGRRYTSDHHDRQCGR